MTQSCHIYKKIKFLKKKLKKFVCLHEFLFFTIISISYP